VKAAAAKEGPASWNSATLDQLSKTYGEAIEPHPEEEFHRAIQRLNIRYGCVLEDNEGTEDEE
jgi:hypothetical protein